MLKQLMARFEQEFIGQQKEWYPVNDSVYCGRISDAELEAMRARNEQAIQDCIDTMGDKWVLAKTHQVQRLTNECK
jgi:hypothetical protein